MTASPETATPENAGRTPIMAGNWKMNLNHLEAIAQVQKLAFGLNDKDFAAVEVAVLPPLTDLRAGPTLFDGDKLKIKYGAQDISLHDSGAYTGEISGSMLAKLKCTYVVVGHSERREYHGESDALCNGKVKAAFRHGLTPILCVGEPGPVREEGRHIEHTVGQVEAALKDIPAEQTGTMVVAYEPVWAIGTGKTCDPNDAQEVCAAIRGKIAELYTQDVADKIRIQYGGSVKASSIAGIMAQPDIDGALVGGASLDPDEYVKIVRFRDQ
jgi:triosephosphate isomerase